MHPLARQASIARRASRARIASAASGATILRCLRKRNVASDRGFQMTKEGSILKGSGNDIIPLFQRLSNRLGLRKVTSFLLRQIGIFESSKGLAASRKTSGQLVHGTRVELATSVLQTDGFPVSLPARRVG